jgi:hypothetical protein
VAPPIFRNRSYIFSVGLSESIVNRLSHLGARLGFRLLEMPSLADCLAGAAKTDNLVCVLEAGSSGEDEKKSFIQSTGVQIHQVGLGGSLVEDGALEAKFQELLSNSVSANFKKIAKIGLETGVSALAGGSSITFNEDYSYGAQPEALIYTDLVDGTLFFRGQIEFSMTDLQGPILQTLVTESKRIDFFKEVSNQVMGIVSHNMRKLGLDTRGGVPYFADMRAAEPPKFSNFFWGGQFSAPELPGVKVRLGYFDSARNPIPDFDKIEVDSPDSEVEFL